VVRQGLAEDDGPANVRAVVEAQALSSRLHSRWMGVEVSSLFVTGGASANAQILQVYADVHGCPVRRFATTSAAALGAALRAWHGEQAGRGRDPSWDSVVGPFARPLAGSTIEPDPTRAALYAERLDAYARLEQGHAAAGGAGN
jgi:sugar (pentulose or hexulose) kinase